MIIVSGATIAEAAQRLNLQVQFDGCDGSSWDLVNGPVRLTSGVQGLGPPDTEHWWRVSPSLAGSLHVGQRVPRGQVTLPVRITTRDSALWLTYHTAFMRAVNPSAGLGLCYLRVTAPGRPQRSLQMRPVGGASPAFEFDPVYRQHAAFTLDFAADWPYWSDVVSTYVWGRNGASGIPVNTPGVKTVSNPGDAPVYGWWALYGPWTRATFGLGAGSSARVSTLSRALLPAGDGRIVQTDPRAADQLAVTDLDGGDAWADVLTRDWAAPIPIGASVAVSIAMSGHDPALSSIVLQFVPAYRLPW